MESDTLANHGNSNSDPAVGSQAEMKVKYLQGILRQLSISLLYKISQFFDVGNIINFVKQKYISKQNAQQKRAWILNPVMV